MTLPPIATRHAWHVSVAAMITAARDCCDLDEVSRQKIDAFLGDVALLDVDSLHFVKEELLQPRSVEALSPLIQDRQQFVQAIRAIRFITDGSDEGRQLCQQLRCQCQQFSSYIG